MSSEQLSAAVLANRYAAIVAASNGLLSMEQAIALYNAHEGFYGRALNEAQAVADLARWKQEREAYAAQAPKHTAAQIKQMRREEAAIGRAYRRAR